MGTIILIFGLRGCFIFSRGEGLWSWLIIYVFFGVFFIVLFRGIVSKVWVRGWWGVASRWVLVDGVSFVFGFVIERSCF